ASASPATRRRSGSRSCPTFRRARWARCSSGCFGSMQRVLARLRDFGAAPRLNLEQEAVFRSEQVLRLHVLVLSAEMQDESSGDRLPWQQRPNRRPSVDGGLASAALTVTRPTLGLSP